MSGPILGHFGSLSGFPGQKSLFFSLVSKLKTKDEPFTVLLTQECQFPTLNMTVPMICSFQGLPETFPAGPLVCDLQATFLHEVHHARHLFEQVDLYLVSLSPSIEDIAHAKNILGRLLVTGVGREKIWFILVNAGLPSGVPVTFVEKELGPLAFTLPYDPGLLTLAENEAKLLEEVRPKALVTRKATELAHKVSEYLIVR
jgi:hypothetical protein